MTVPVIECQIYIIHEVFTATYANNRKEKEKSVT